MLCDGRLSSAVKKFGNIFHLSEIYFILGSSVHFTKWSTYPEYLHSDCQLMCFFMPDSLSSAALNLWMVSGQTASGNTFSVAVRTRHRGSWNIRQTFGYSSSRLLFTDGWSGRFLLSASNWMTSGRWCSIVPGSASACDCGQAWTDDMELEEMKAHAAHCWHLWISTETFLNINSCPPSHLQRRTLEDRHVRGEYIHIHPEFVLLLPSSTALHYITLHYITLHFIASYSCEPTAIPSV